MKDKERSYVEFTAEMKRDYTILAPDMLPIHFDLIGRVLQKNGYKFEVLQEHGSKVTDLGLKYVHNDACYPAILVIGQFLEAITSGKYDPHKVALILFQTGGGCRASNYIFLLRKALSRAGYGYVPVISFNLLGMEKHSGFKLTLPILYRMLYAVLYGDLLLSMINQCKPYEINRGETEALAEKISGELADMLSAGVAQGKRYKKTCRDILERFAAVAQHRDKKAMVGIVGEIYVKYSPLGNNHLADFLVDEGAEVLVPGLLDFCLYCVYNSLVDCRFYRLGRLKAPFIKFAYRYLVKKQNVINALISNHGVFTRMPSFEDTVELTKGYISHGAKMGEGWLLTAEMLEMSERGVNNIVCAQPFGCLPNHICGKGMIKPLKDSHPELNIVAIDYDPGASVVNQENRLKLMLSNAVPAGCSEQGNV